MTFISPKVNNSIFLHMILRIFLKNWERIHRPLHFKFKTDLNPSIDESIMLALSDQSLMKNFISYLVVLMRVSAGLRTRVVETIFLLIIGQHNTPHNILRFPLMSGSCWCDDTIYFRAIDCLGGRWAKLITAKDKWWARWKWINLRWVRWVVWWHVDGWPWLSRSVGSVAENDLVRCVISNSN